MEKEKNITQMVLKFEGKYLNGEKWNGKEYDNEGKFILKL